MNKDLHRQMEALSRNAGLHTISDEHLLVAINDVIQTMPPLRTLSHHTDESIAWFGRAAAVIHQWDVAQAIAVDGFLRNVHSDYIDKHGPAITGVRTLLFRARHDLQLRTQGPTSIAVEQGKVFDYFEQIRRCITEARKELYFVDPYLDATFVSRYLPLAVDGVAIRLLSGPKTRGSLLPAVELFCTQHSRTVAVRISPTFHDRYLFADRSACYQSGTSFKEGSVKAPTTVTQIIDAFPAMWNTYDNMWLSAKDER